MSRRKLKSLSEYIRESWHVIEPATEYLSNWHIDLMSEYLEACYRRDITRLIINIPPRYMKSICVSVAFPTWAWTQEPALRFQCASYSSSLSTKHNKDRRDIVDSEWYRGLWGDRVVLSDDQNLKTEFQNTAKGHMISTSVGGTSTGKGGDFLIVDDPHNPLEAESEVRRQTGLEWFDQTFSTRLNDKQRGVMIVVMQRLHEEDLTGHLLAGDESWEHVCLPVTEDKPRVITFPSGREHFRNPEEVLWPERENEKQVATMYKRLGPYGYAGQYMQRPSPKGGGKFKREWFVLERASEQPTDLIRYYYTDTSEGKKNSDNIATGCWSIYQGRIIIWEVASYVESFDKSLGRWDGEKYIPGVYDQIVERNGSDRHSIHFIEAKSTGQAWVDHLRANTKHNVRGDNPGSESKEVRAFKEIPTIYARRVVLIDGPWVEDFLSEIEVFPNGKQDGMVDVLASIIRKSDIGDLADDPGHRIDGEDEVVTF